MVKIAPVETGVRRFFGSLASRQRAVWAKAQRFGGQSSRNGWAHFALTLVNGSGTELVSARATTCVEVSTHRWRTKPLLSVARYNSPKMSDKTYGVAFLMPHFKVLPSSDPESAIEIDSADGAAALYAASRMGFRQADVFRDGSYLFSVSKQGRETGFWGIFHTPQLADKEAALIGSPGQP